MFEIFCKTLPTLCNIQHIPKDNHILVFEPTRWGYKQVIGWLEKNPNKICWRLIISLSSECVDVGDALVEKNFDIFDNPYVETLQLVPILRAEEDKRSESDYPFKTQHSLLDFKCGLNYLEKHVLLPDPLLGYSLVQKYMIDNYHHSENVLLAMSSVFFDIPIIKLKSQYENLHHGSLPIINNIQHVKFIPFLLLDGSFPLSWKTIKDAIIMMINTNKIDELMFKTSPWDAGDGYSYAQKNAEKYIIKPPYRVRNKLFHQKNIFYYSPQPNNPFCFLSQAPHLIKTKIEWNGECNKLMFFESPHSYFKWWYEANKLTILNCYQEYINKCNEQRLRCEFLRTLFIQSSFNDQSDSIKRCFYDEPLISKQMRITKEYNNNQQFLDLPIKDIDQENIIYSPSPTFESARDYWIHIINLI